MTDEPKDSPDNPDEPPEKKPAKTGSFGIDSGLAEAMAAAEESYSKLEDEARKERGLDEPEPVIEEEDEDDDGEGFALDLGDEDDDEDAPAPAPKKGSPPTSGAPTSGGAGEGIVRALAQMKQALETAEEAEQRAAVAEQKAENAENRWTRVSADFDNFKKRIDRERQEEKKYANEKLLKDLFPVLDSLDRAIEAAEGSTVEQFAQGVEMVRKQFVDMLGKFGVEQFSALGEAFDPEFHEAMQQQETTEAEPGTVVSEYIKGYMLNGRLARPSMVIVAKAPAGEAQNAEDAPAATEQPGSPAEAPEIGDGQNVAEGTASGDTTGDTGGDVGDAGEGPQDGE